MLPNVFEYDSIPVVVEVTEDRYEVFSLSPTPTRRDLWLMSLIYEMGGINENVERGSHHFTATRIGPDQVEVSLTKI